MNYKCPNCGANKNPLNACRHCNFSWSGKSIKPIARKKVNLVNTSSKMKVNQVRTLPIKNVTKKKIPERGSRIGLGVKSNLIDGNQGKFGTPADRHKYSPDILINIGWTH